ncbi:hypothetical protein PAUR_a3838 [Pseudoalteromonas aurantia 208]|uniref:Transposase n=1 Tax=Pseudoalteromonas aurantia 208 TaxID=1314867 RepID=A0ABR9E6Z6_9GAMM|nr:hypothetical protein [Pseudoalteromonas aurantia 208]
MGKVMGTKTVAASKNIAQIGHTRHRSCMSFMVKLIAGLIVYTFQAKKPSIKVTRL